MKESEMLELSKRIELMLIKEIEHKNYLISSYKKLKSRWYSLFYSDSYLKEVQDMIVYSYQMITHLTVRMIEYKNYKTK
jgi:hypothetical protein